jgi:hypothetical protein
VLGDNGSGIDGINYTFRNGTVGTTSGTASAAINRVDGCLFENIQFNGPFDTITGENRVTNCLFKNCTIDSILTNSMMRTRFDYEDTKFTEGYLTKKGTQIDFRSLLDQTLAVSATETITDILLGDKARSFDVIVRLESYNNSSPRNQAGWVEYTVRFDTDGDGTFTNGVTLVETSSVGGSVNRKLVLAVIGNELVITNSGSVTVVYNYTVTGSVNIQN